MSRIALGTGVLRGIVFAGVIAKAEPVQTGALDNLQAHRRG